MPQIQILTCSDQSYLKHLISYVDKPSRNSQHMIGATNLYLRIIKDRGKYCVFKQIQDFFDIHKRDKKRLALHVIIEFSPSECMYLDAQKVLKIGYQFSCMEFPNCITYFGVHDHSEYLHLDMLLIPIDIYTGNSCGYSQNAWYKFGYDIRELLLQYMPEENISNVQTLYGRQ